VKNCWGNELTYTVKPIDRNAWLTAAKSFNDYTFTHFWEYAKKAADRVGAASEHVAIYSEDGTLAGLCDVRIKRLPLGLGGIAYVSGGPMVDQGDGTVEKHLPNVLGALRRRYAIEQGLVLRISQRHKTVRRRDVEEALYRQCEFKAHGCTNATILIDLTTELEQIRKRFHQKWRNVLNKSERQHIEVVAGGAMGLFDDFSLLFSDLVASKGFDVNLDDHFFADVQRCSPSQEQFHIAIAYHDGQPVGGHLSSICGDTSVYLLGAVNEAGRKLGAAYLLQWHAICESKHRGCSWYDLGGINREENPHVFLFKQRMGGEETEVAHVFQCAEGLRGAVSLLLEKIYRALRPS